jgi:hypothetical protein
MNAGASRLYELRPDPYDKTQRKFLRVCLVLQFIYLLTSDIIGHLFWNKKNIEVNLFRIDSRD